MWACPAARMTEVLAQPRTRCSPATTARDASTELAWFAENRRVAVGMSRDQVVASMRGQPDDTLSSDVWIYWNFRAPQRVPTKSYTALLVIFEGARVKLIRLADAAATKILLARWRAASLSAQPAPQP